MADISHPTLAGAQPDVDATSECSSSAMDISSPSRSPSPEPEPARTVPAVLPPSLTKRKADDFVDVADMSYGTLGNITKRQKQLPQPLSPGTDSAHILLPEQWQHIFVFLSPFDLASVMRVCRKFNHLLCEIKIIPASKKSQDKPRMMDSDTVWARARKLHFPSLPRALNIYNELQMLQLIGNKSCQICGSLPSNITPPVNTAFNGGPGADRIRVIWQFGVRLCGKCFLQNTLTDIEVLQSEASALRAGLPHAFRTADAHYVLDLVRQLPGGIPSHLHVNKVYYNKDITAIVRDRDEVKEFGDGAAEEWRKGLPSKGKERMTDASRWERWENNLRLGVSLLDALREYHFASLSRNMKSVDRIAGGGENSTLPKPISGKQCPGLYPFYLYCVPPWSRLHLSAYSRPDRHSSTR
nr:hypothetical protein CFP56_09932 [Quercus suber]